MHWELPARWALGEARVPLAISWFLKHSHIWLSTTKIQGERKSPWTSQSKGQSRKLALHLLVLNSVTEKGIWTTLKLPKIFEYHDPTYWLEVGSAFVQKACSKRVQGWIIESTFLKCNTNSFIWGKQNAVCIAFLHRIIKGDEKEKWLRDTNWTLFWPCLLLSNRSGCTRAHIPIWEVLRMDLCRQRMASTTTHKLDHNVCTGLQFKSDHDNIMCSSTPVCNGYLKWNLYFTKEKVSYHIMPSFLKLTLLTFCGTCKWRARQKIYRENSYGSIKLFNGLSSSYFWQICT